MHRHRKHGDVRLTKGGNAMQKQATIRDVYRVTNQQRMAARRALEWIKTLKAWLVFRYEISDLFSRILVCGRGGGV